jgi:methylmalonyl-CoA mutase
MPMNPAPVDPLPLAAEFPHATREDWLKLVDDVLKGASFENRLVARTYDGLRIEPIHPRAANAAPIIGRTAATPWQVLARVELPDPAAANAEARHELENGATGLLLVFKGAIGARGFGLDRSREALTRLLEGIDCKGGIALELDLGAETGAALELADLLTGKGIDAHAADVRFGFDPFGTMARDGGSASPWPQAASTLSQQIQKLASGGWRGPFAAADGRPVHDAGGSEAQELAFVLAGAVAWLRALEASGWAIEEARRVIFFRLVADSDQFVTMAKIRAFRRLWARVEQACGLAPAPAFVSCETAWRTLTRRDPWVNMLRTTVAAFAAGLGGANAVSVLPFTTALGLPDRFARRIARNTQLVLLGESNLARVADPAAGSGGIEALTEGLAAATWLLFQQIESAGGLAAALEAGLLQQQIAQVLVERQRAIATRRAVLTGTSEFPHLAELPVAVLDAERYADVTAGTGRTFAPLPAYRLAEPFERLREASDRRLQDTGSRPTVFLANLGPLAAFTARATFAKNFFEAGGIEAVTNDGFAGAAASTDLTALAAAFRASKASLACLCSSDETYTKEAVAAAAALKDAGVRRLYLAGRPGELEAAQRSAGVEEFIHAGCNALTVLEAAYHDVLR